MLIKDQFGIIQSLQTFPIPQTSFLVGIFFCCFLKQDGFSSVAEIYWSSGDFFLRPRHMFFLFSSFVFLLHIDPYKC